nr:M56 family metallopeptidase [Maliibacterium massiliense]
MLTNIFLQVLNQSFAASFVIAFVLLARLLLALAKAPKGYSFALWSVVWVRLLIPLRLESAHSLLPIAAAPAGQAMLYSAQPQVHTGLAALDGAINAALPAGTPYMSANPLQALCYIGALLWLAGVALFLLYSAVSLLRLRRRLTGAVRLQDNIYLADHIASPFVLGVVSPRIYLPSALDERQRRHILLHEQIHIRRKDHLVKIVAFLALAIHWFNPLAWAAFLCCNRDMEMSCDERVLRQAGPDISGAYAASLLQLATGRQIPCGAPLAFGEGSAKGRIRHVLRYKKPARVRALIAGALTLALGVALLFTRALPATRQLARVTILYQQQEARLGSRVLEGAQALALAQEVQAGAWRPAAGGDTPAARENYVLYLTYHTQQGEDLGMDADVYEVFLRGEKGLVRRAGDGREKDMDASFYRRVATLWRGD